jgi:hypothetical protein
MPEGAVRFSSPALGPIAPGILLPDRARAHRPSPALIVVACRLVGAITLSIGEAAFLWDGAFRRAGSQEGMGRRLVQQGL